MRAPPPSVVATEAELRAIFNRERLWQRARAGEFRVTVLKDGHPTSPKAKLPFCTRSQIIAYRDSDGQLVAIVHQYLKPDGTLGASGRPDPKRVFHEGTFYYVVQTPPVK